MKMFLMFGLILILAGCSSDNTIDPAVSNDRITISNNPEVLANRINHSMTEIELQSVPGTKDASGSIPHSFTLVGEVTPPSTVDGIEVRATFVEIHGDLAYVTYNKEGEVFSGAVEVIDISNPSYPQVVSQALFDDTDLAALSVEPDGSRIYLAGARDTDASGFNSPAILERMLLNNGRLSTVSACFDVQSWVANGIVWNNQWLCVTSGNSTGAGQAGGAGAINFSKVDSLEIINWNGFNNAQYVTEDDSRIVVLQGGANASLRLFDKSASTLVLTNQLALDAISPADGKNTLTLKNNVAYVAMGEAGVKAISLTDGSVLNWLASPTPDSGDPADYISNAVALDDDYLYIANGGGGLYVCPIPTQNGEMAVGGTWDFQSSANYVETSGNHIFVASGTGGLKILRKSEDAHPMGMALDFPGAVSVSMDVPTEFKVTQDLTLECWYYPRDSASWSGPISFMTDNGHNESGYCFQFHNGKFLFSVVADNMAGNHYTDGPKADITMNQWVHVAGVYDGTSAKIYINGQLVDEIARSGNINFNHDILAFKLGKFYDSNESNYINGSLDEVRVWSVARTQVEIQASMNNVLSGREVGLIGYWNFDEGPDSEVIDKTTNGNNGHLYGITSGSWIESGAGISP